MYSSRFVTGSVIVAQLVCPVQRRAPPWLCRPGIVVPTENVAGIIASNYHAVVVGVRILASTEGSVVKVRIIYLRLDSGAAESG